MPFITTANQIVRVYWLGSDETDITPDTPNRGYGIIVHQEGWATR